MNQVNRGSLLHLLLSRGQIWLPNMAIHGIRCRIANPKKHRVNYSYTDAGPVLQNDRDLPSYPSHLQRLDLKQHSFLDLGAELTLVLCCLSHRSGFQDLALHLITRCYQTWLENNLLDPFSSMGFPSRKQTSTASFWFPRHVRWHRRVLLVFSGESSARDLVQSSWTRGILLEAFRQPNLSAKCVQSSVQSVGWENVDMSDMSIKTI